jgi:type I restriction enzyme S subunit
MATRPPWPAVALVEVATIQTGIAKGKEVHEANAVEMPYLRVANVQDGFVDLEEVKALRVHQSAVQRHLLRDGDVLFTEGGDDDKLGRGCVWRGQIDPCLHQNHIFAVRPDRARLLPEFLAEYAASTAGKAYFADCAKRTTNLASINKTQLGALPVPLPSLAEQRTIAAVMSATDSALQAAARVVDQLRCVRDLALAELVENADGRNVTLRDVAAVITKGTTPTTYGHQYTDAGVPFLRVENITDDGTLDLQGVKHISVSTHEALARSRLQPGDVLFSIAGALGRTAVVPRTVREANTNQAVALVRLDREKADAAFIGYVLRSRTVREQVTLVGSRLAQANLSLQQVGALRINLPPLSLQEGIAASLKTIDYRLDSELRAYAALLSVRASLRDGLLSGSLRVPSGGVAA